MILSAPTIGAIAGATIGAGLGWGVYKACQWVDHTYNQGELDNDSGQRQNGVGNKKKPPYDGKELGTDPAKCPGEGFEWNGKGGPETGKGSWVKGNRPDGTLERLHPDFDHPPPISPHWDYEGPDGKARLNIDGTCEWK